MVRVTIEEPSTNRVHKKVLTDKEGFFTVQLPIGRDYIITTDKNVFKTAQTSLSTVGKSSDKKIYTKIEMSREPGYLFEVTMAEKLRKDEDGKLVQVDAIQGALVEIYNNTREEEAMILKDHPNPTFGFTFEKGNHYTVMIRKEGYFTKRMEAYVDVDGCILCFDGLDEVTPGRPGASDNLTGGNTMGTIMSNVELTPIKINESIKINNIYYDSNKANIRDDAAKELDKLILTLRDNPALIVELGSHTDATGKDEYNKKLSQKRAEEAVRYITSVGDISKRRITGKGYGETFILNECKNGVKCSDRKHQVNRRTELKIVGIDAYNPYNEKSLAAIIKEEKYAEMLAEVMDQEVVEIKEGEDLPDELKSQIGGTSKNTPPSSGGVASTPIQDTPPMPTSNYPSGAPANDISMNSTSTTEPVFEDINSSSGTAISMTDMESSGSVANSSNSNIGFDDDFEFVESTASEQPQIVEEHQVYSTFKSRPPSSIELDYSGYKIEFYTSSSELPLSHEIFSKHGNIVIEQKKNGAYAYLIGDFNNKTSAKNFTRDVISKTYPSARVVKYVNGLRANY